MAWLCDSVRATTPGPPPSHLEFARWPDGASLPPPGHPFWSQPHAAEVAVQALESARRDKANAEAQLAVANARTQPSALSSTALAEAQSELAELRGRYEALRGASVADVASRVSAHVSAGSSVPGAAQQQQQQPEAADALRRCQAALLREREARVRAEAEGDALSVKVSELETALLAEQSRANDLTRRLLAGIDASRESLAAGGGPEGGPTASPTASSGEHQVAPSVSAPPPPPPLDERGVPIPPSMLDAGPPAARGDGEGASVSAARMAAEEARARAAEAANASLVRESDFLRAKLRAAEEDVKAARDAEMKTRSKYEAFSSMARVSKGGSAMGTNAAIELERERTRARTAEAAASAATAAASEAAARAAAAEAAAAAAAQALQAAVAERDAARAALPPPPPPPPELAPEAASNGGDVAGPAPVGYLPPEAEEALAREAGEKNAALRECDALQRRIKALEKEVAAEKERSRAAELKARARLEAVQAQQAAARKS